VASDRSTRRRCPGCGSRLEAGARQCLICGQPVPWRLSVSGAAVESALLVGLVVVVAIGLVWMRRSGRGPWAGSARTSSAELLSMTPTDVPTPSPGVPVTPSVPANTPGAATVTASPESVTHVVASGDTLYGIAAQYGVSTDTIIAANALARPDALSIGQQLLIPVAPQPSTPEPPVVAADAGAATGAPPAGTDSAAASGGVASAPTGAEVTTAAPAPTGEPVVVRAAEVYTVTTGDTIGGIAGAHGLSAEALVALNADWGAGLDQLLQIGDRVVVRAAEVVTATPEPIRTTTSTPLEGASGNSPGVPGAAGGVFTYSAPVPLAPVGGVLVADEAPLLRWSSVGVLARGVFYVVSVRAAGSADAEVDRQWVFSNATAVRVPSRFRPALGSTRDLEWSVGVRQRVGRLIGGDEGVLVGPDTGWQTFVWSPGAGDATSEHP
jgi:LysM repeat protein